MARAMGRRSDLHAGRWGILLAGRRCATGIGERAVGWSLEGEAGKERRAKLRAGGATCARLHACQPALAHMGCSDTARGRAAAALYVLCCSRSNACARWPLLSSRPANGCVTRAAVSLQNPLAAAFRKGTFEGSEGALDAPSRASRMPWEEGSAQ
jgi:hypothetical protein